MSETKGIPDGFTFAHKSNHLSVAGPIRDKTEARQVLNLIKTMMQFLPDREFVPPAAKDLSEAMDEVYGNVVPLRAA